MASHEKAMIGRKKGCELSDRRFGVERSRDTHGERTGFVRGWILVGRAGRGTGAMDDDGFTFWPLDNITSDPGLGPWRGLLVFADRQLGPPHFCIRFEGERAGGVVLATGEEVAASFDAFLERYVMDARGIVSRH